MATALDAHATEYVSVGPVMPYVIATCAAAAFGIAFTTDYNLVLSRLLFISKNAQHPNAAKLFVDYVLSKKGQTIAAEQADLYSVRTDITGKDSGTGLTKEYGNAIKPIAVNTDLLAGLEQSKRLEFMKQWQSSLGRK